MPNQSRGMAEHAHGVDGVLVAVRGGELEDGKVHFCVRPDLPDVRSLTTDSSTQFPICNPRSPGCSKNDGKPH